ncbi:MAG TPA: hypothetical protein VF070_15660 [Streptosporangiaceae bacterium]
MVSEDLSWAFRTGSDQAAWLLDRVAAEGFLTTPQAEMRRTQADARE